MVDTRWATGTGLTYGKEYNRIQLIQRGRGIGPTKPRQPTQADALVFIREAACDHGANSDPPCGRDEE
jgi:hypothetical protein